MSGAARAHLEARDDELVTLRPLLWHVDGWPAFLDQGLSDDEAASPRKHETAGRPAGDALVEKLEVLVARPPEESPPREAAAKRGIARGI